MNNERLTIEERTIIEDTIINMLVLGEDIYNEADVECMVEDQMVEYGAPFLMQDLLNATKNIIDHCGIKRENY